MKHTATAYRIYDCPTCDGESDEAIILFSDTLDGIVKYRLEYFIDRIYVDGVETYRCEYKTGHHRIHKVLVCHLDRYGEADENNIFRVLESDK